MYRKIIQALSAVKIIYREFMQSTLGFNNSHNAGHEYMPAYIRTPRVKVRNKFRPW